MKHKINEIARVMKKNKKLTIVIAALILNILCFTAIFAYFTSSDAKVNEFTVGINETPVEEEFVPPDKMVPGSEIVKKIRLHNVKTPPCVVRCRIDFSDSDMENLVDIDYDTEKWHLRDDGYWYYKGVLGPDDLTSALMQYVKVSEDATESQIKDFDIYVYAESKSCKLTDKYYDVWGFTPDDPNDYLPVEDGNIDDSFDDEFVNDESGLQTEPADSIK